MDSKFEKVNDKSHTKMGTMNKKMEQNRKEIKADMENMWEKLQNIEVKPGKLEHMGEKFDERK